MASFWFWFFTIILSTIGGALGLIILWGLWTLGRDAFFLKKGIPKIKEKVSEYIKERPEKFQGTNPGKVSEENYKEVEEDERRRNKEYREFEKLRRAELKRKVGGSQRDDSNSKKSQQLPGRELLSNDVSRGDKLDKSRDGNSKPSVKLDG